MSDWVGAILKRVERFTGSNWLEFLDERVRLAVRQLAQRCQKCGVQCVSWIKRKSSSHFGQKKRTRDSTQVLYSEVIEGERFIPTTRLVCALRKSCLVQRSQLYIGAISQNKERDNFLL
jgi:hypothetical protein